MIISENNIEKALNYFESLDDTKYESTVDKLLEEQAYLSTFVQQNLDNIFDEENKITDFSYNLYFTVLYMFKSKNSDKYKIVDDKILNSILKKEEFEHKQEELGDFIYTQFVESEFPKDDFLKVIGLLSVVIICLDY